MSLMRERERERMVLFEGGITTKRYAGVQRQTGHGIGFTFQLLYNTHTNIMGQVLRAGENFVQGYRVAGHLLSRRCQCSTRDAANNYVAVPEPRNSVLSL